MNHLKIARVLVVLGFSIGLISLSYTVTHIGDPTYKLVSEFELGSYHAWYHAFREAAGDIATMAAILFIFFGPSELRNKSTWVICLILMLGFYAPFWVGIPFLPELSAPNWQAELTHILMAFFPLLGLFISRDVFLGGSQKISLHRNGDQ